MFEESLTKLKDCLEAYITEDEDLESRYQIIIPYVLRGILIHMLFDYFGEDNNEFEILVQYTEILINSKRETNNYFERYLI